VATVDASMATGYPVQVNFASGSNRRSRLTVLFRPILAIPAIIVLYLHLIGFLITTVLSWFAILLTGRYPSGFHSYGVNTMRLTACVMSYLLFLTDEYPPWSGSGSKAQNYPVQYSVSYPGKSSRLTVLFRYILAIPAFVFTVVILFVAEIFVIIAWVAILITGRYPPGLEGFVQGAVRCYHRLYGYMYFLVDPYPPFSIT
jgi:uncharacterized membrane protein